MCTGRRHLQVRLVEPSPKSLNSGDCFALVTEKDLFSWIGKESNPYEKAKVLLYELLCAVFSISTFTPISIIADTTIVTDQGSKLALANSRNASGFSKLRV